MGCLLGASVCGVIEAVSFESFRCFDNGALEGSEKLVLDCVVTEGVLSWRKKAI